MVEETIQVIKETEAKADAIVKDADAQCKKMLEQASQRVETLKAEQIAGAQKKAESMLQQAKAEGEKSQETAVLTVLKEVEALKELASQKEREAISLVITQLV